MQKHLMFTHPGLEQEFEAEAAGWSRAGELWLMGLMVRGGMAVLFCSFNPGRPRVQAPGPRLPVFLCGQAPGSSPRPRAQGPRPRVQAPSCRFPCAS